MGWGVFPPARQWIICKVSNHQVRRAPDRIRRINPSSQKTAKLIAGPIPPMVTTHVKNAPNASLAVSVWASNTGYKG
jgi:hypothetical protein